MNTILRPQTIFIHTLATVLLCLAVLCPTTSIAMNFLNFMQEGSITVDGVYGATSITVTPNGYNVYVTNDSYNSVALFSRNLITGDLVFIEKLSQKNDGIPCLEDAGPITVSPDNKYVYIGTDPDDDAIAVFSRHPATGRLTFLQCYMDGENGIVDLYNTKAMIISPDNKHLYVASSYDNIITFSRDVNTGDLTFVDSVADGENGINGLYGIDAITISADNKHIYAVSDNDDSIVVFERDTKTGKLSFVEMKTKEDEKGNVITDGLEGAISVIISPDDKHVYVASNDDDAIVVFERDFDTGKLTFLEIQQNGINGVNGLEKANSVLISQDNYVYVANDYRNNDIIAIFRRNPETGKLTFVDVEQIFVDDDISMALSSNDLYLVAEDHNMLESFRYDIDNNELSVLRGIPDGDIVEITELGLKLLKWITLSLDNKFIYVINSDSITVFHRDLKTGILTFVDRQTKNEFELKGLSNPDAIIISPDNKYIYVTSNSEDTVTVFRRHLETGRLTFVEIKEDGIDGVKGLKNATWITMSSDSQHIYVVGDGTSGEIAVFSHNIDTGTLNFVEAYKEGIAEIQDMSDATSIVMSPDGHHLYIVGDDYKSITIFNRNANSLAPDFGKLTFVEVHQDSSLESLDWNEPVMTVSSDNQHVYVGSDQHIIVFNRNSNSSDSEFGKLSFVEILTDDENGIDGLNDISSIRVSPNGNHLYVGSSGDEALTVFSRNPNTGQLTLIKSRWNGKEDVTGLSNPKSIAISLDNKYVYIANRNTDGITTFTTIINQPPKNNIPTTNLTIEENSFLVLSSDNGNVISVSDPDAFTHPLEVTLTVEGGTLTLKSTTNLIFSNGDGIDDVSMIFTGTFTDINTALDGMTFTPNVNFSGISPLQITTNDLGNTGSGGPRSSNEEREDIINITVNTIIGQPSITPAATNENTQTTNGLVISRNEGDGVEVSHFQITNITGGTLYHNDGTTPINNGDFITFADGNLGLRFTPNSTQNGSFNVQSATCDNETCLGGDPEAAQIMVNTPPILGAIGHQAVNVGETLQFTASATDNQNTLRFSLGSPLDGANIDPNTGQFTWMPTHSGTYNVTINVTEVDGNPSNLRDYEDITIIVSTAPQFESISDHYPLVFGKSLNFQAIASHPEGHALRFSLTEAPPTAKINASNGEFTWEPTGAGQYHATVVVTETVGNHSVEQPITIDVEKAQTSLRFWLDSSAIFKDSGVVNLSGQLNSYPDVKEHLAGLDIDLTIFAPNGSFFLADTTQTQEDGKFTFNQLSHFEQEGPYTFKVSFTGTNNLASARPQEDYLQVRALAGHALLIQGRLLDDPDGIETHNKSLNRVYRRLKARGFEDQNIEYLNYNTDQSAFEIDVDGKPSHANIETAFQRIQQRMNADPGPLYVIMVDHGGVEGNFYLDEGNQEYISPTDLDGWLDKLEAGLLPLAKQQERVTIIGSCYSGSYIPMLSAPGRVIVTSTTETEESYKGPKEPDEVRSGEFFIEALFAEFGKGQSLKTAFEIATQNTEMLTRIGNHAPLDPKFNDRSAQHPLLDDDSDKTGSNVFWADSLEGFKAKDIYLGIGPNFNLNPLNFNPYRDNHPLMILAVTPTTYLGGNQTGYPLFAEVNHPNKVAGKSDGSKPGEIVVNIRAPSVTLSTDGTEQTGQLEIDGLQRITLKADSRKKFTGYFNGFTEPGQYEILYFANDSETGEMALQRSVVYKKPRFDNQPPQAFNLLYPEDKTETKTNVIFDWGNAIDPEGDFVTYTFSIATDPEFQQEVYRQEGLTFSMSYVDENTVIDEGVAGTRFGLRDDTEYFWRVQAIDYFGNRTNSTPTVFSFITNNKNIPPNLADATLTGDEFDAQLSDNALQTEGPNEPNTVYKDCQGMICRVFLKALTQVKLMMQGFRETTISESGNYRLRRKNPVAQKGTIQFLVDSLRVAEDRGKVNILVKRVGGSDGDISVKYATLDDSATAETDYIPVTDDLIWKDQETLSKRITLEIQDDSYFEGDETFVLKLMEKSPLTPLYESGEALVGKPNQILLTIVDNEEAHASPEPINQENQDDSKSDDSGENQADDGTGGNQATEGSGDTQVKEDSSKNQADNQPGNNQADDKSVENQVNEELDKDGTDAQSDEVIPEMPDETATPSTTVDASSVITISGDEHQETQHTPSPSQEGNQTAASFGVCSEVVSPLLRGDLGVCELSSLQFSERTYAVSENQETVEIVVTRTNSKAGKVSVKYQAIEGTAKTGEDYQLEPGTLTWTDGEDGEKSFEIAIVNNNQAGPHENFLLALSDVTGHAKLGEISHAILTINDDETTEKLLICPKPEIPSCDKKEIEENLESSESSSLDDDISNSSGILPLENEEPKEISYSSSEQNIFESIFSDEIITNIGCNFVAESELIDCVSNKLTECLLPQPEQSGNITNDPKLPELGHGKTIRFGKIANAPNDASFAGGISINLGDYHIQEKLELSDWIEITGKILEITGKITVDPIHIGEKADILVVAGYIPPSEEKVTAYYLQNAEKFWFSWDGDMESLLPFQSTVTLEPTHFIEIFTSNWLPDMPGKFQLYFGYRLENGTIIFNGEQQIEVEIEKE